MDNSDEHGFEFLDLSEVDEVERNLLLESLQYHGPNVQLPWNKPFSAAVCLKHTKKLTVKSPSPTDEPPYDNQIITKKFVQNLPQITNDIVSKPKPIAEVKPFTQNSQESSAQLQNGGDDHITPQTELKDDSFSNGVDEAPQTNTSPANKSWASLFVSPKANHDKHTDLRNAFNNQAVNSELNDGNACPIKYPRRGAIADPDCYRMGEFLIDYSVDGRAVSLQPRGLINQSNYCYINSILQALLACPPLYNLLAGLATNISSNATRKPTPVIDGMCRFVKEFEQLPSGQRVSRRAEKHSTKKEQSVLINYDTPFEPSWIYRMLNGIRSDLMEGRQEDAEEFLGCLLNGLNDEMLELIKLVKNDKSDENKNDVNSDCEQNDKEWQVMGPKNKGSVTRRTDFGRTPISDIFGGLLKSKIQRTGDLSTENIQPFFTLQLNIEKVKSVREALEALVTKNQLEGVTSSKTNEEVEAWQQVMLDELPVVLVLHLKCFDFKLDGCTKIIKALEFPIDLKMDAKLLSAKTTTPKEKQYKLFAVVYHDGKEASKGHYVTDCFHVGYSSWLRYDDASVKAVQEEQVLKPLGTRVPYLLFYRRGDTIRSK